MNIDDLQLTQIEQDRVIIRELRKQIAENELLSAPTCGKIIGALTSIAVELCQAKTKIESNILDATVEATVYQKEGFKNREEYLMSLSEEYGVPFSVVLSLANVLGESEDFDGLLNELEDAEGMFEEED